jgi:hypothetical protein
MGEMTDGSEGKVGHWRDETERNVRRELRSDMFV